MDYQHYQNLLKQIKLSETDIYNTNIFKLLTSNQYTYKIKTNLWTANMTSMCNKNNVSAIRIRNDNFLKKIKNNNLDVCLLSCIKFNNSILDFVFFGESFVGYDKQFSSSNSFITLDFNDLETIFNNIKDFELFTQIKKYKNEKPKNKKMF